MSTFQLIARSITHHRRLHIGLLMGTVLSCAILTGALLMGDSVDQSLRAIADARLGRIQYAMGAGNRFFAASLAERITSARVAAILSLKGMMAKPPGSGSDGKQLNRVQVIGVESDFMAFAPDGAEGVKLGPQEVAINERTATALDAKVGDDLQLRVTKPGLLPLDAPLSSKMKDPTVMSLVTVKAVLSDTQLGRFSLAANQITPCNVFVSRAWLQEVTEQTGLANTVVADAPVSLDQWQMEDIGLRMRAHPKGIVQLESSQVFLDDETVRAALTTDGATSTLTYLVNSIANGERATPYSFVIAGPVPPDMADDQVVINQWLADQIQAKPGDTLNIAYYQVQPDNSFVEKTRPFTVNSVVPMDRMQYERELAPRFPGLSDVESCSDWDVGMPMDGAKLKDEANEAYWKQYGQTPKLMTTLRAGQEMWGSRFGSVTAVRFAGADITKIEEQLRSRIALEKIGLQFLPVREIGDKAVNQAMDFGGLFVGMSFFLIVAALTLLGMLYVFGLQQRAPEMGVLLALGYTRNRVRAIFFLEACPTALLGSCLGVLAGMGYARILLFALDRWWPAAVAGTSVEFHTSPATLVTGMAVSLCCVLAVVSRTVWRATRFSPHDLLTTDYATTVPLETKRVARWRKHLPTLSLLLAIATLAYVFATKPAALIEPFFAVGTFLLMAALGYYAAFLGWLAARPTPRHPGLWKTVLSGLARRRGRSLSVAGVTACGCFLVFSVSAMQENLALHARERSSGTGGFGIYAETTVPVTGTPVEIQKAFKADVMPLRMRDGDDAGCLNLNRAQQPRLLGMDAPMMGKLGAFADKAVWDLLDQPLPDGVVPALVGDANTAQWGLMKRTGVKDGDELTYRNETGKEFRVKLVGALPMRVSLFQGSILIGATDFTRMFPSESGYRAFLIDPQAGAVDRLNKEYERHGMQAVAAVDRLRDFYAVEMTYLSMFLLLGGIGLILGAGGTGVVVLRNLYERRSEIAILHAIGYEPRIIFRMMLAEHIALVLAGMIIGSLAAAAAILPLVLLSQSVVSVPLQAFMLALIVTTNLVSVTMALWVGLPANAVENLRGE